MALHGYLQRGRSSMMWEGILNQMFQEGDVEHGMDLEAFWQMLLKGYQVKLFHDCKWSQVLVVQLCG